MSLVIMATLTSIVGIDASGYLDCIIRYQVSDKHTLLCSP